MRIAFNPSTVAALIAPPNNKDIIFDLRGHNIFARGVKFCGTDINTWRDIKINNVSIDSNTLDLRDGDNTTLTNINGVVTINSTWRPVVDNLTSDSTTSSLSANQGRILKALIDGKSDSEHTHDDRYVKKSGDTMLGVLTIDTTNFGALTIKRNDDNNGASIQFRGKSSVYGYIGLNNSAKDKQFLRWNSDTSLVYTILDTSSTYTSNGKGVINGTTITQVDNATNATIANQAYNLYYYSADTDEDCKNSKGPGLSSWYTKSSGTSRPTGGDSFMLVMGGTDQKWNSQLCFDMNSTDAIYYRSSDGTPNWRAWTKILTSGSTYVLENKGYINGTQITYVNNAGNATNSTNARKLVNWYSARPTSLNAQFGDGSLRIFYATSSTTEGKPAEDSHILHLAWDNTGGWDAQLAVHTRSGKVSTRAQNSGTWQPWKTLAFTTDIPSSLKNPHALTISLNGTSQGPYDGSAAKNINITPSSIGAATSNHTHPYLPLSGGTVTGNIILKGGTSADMTYADNVHPYIRFDNSDSSQNVSLIFTDYDAYRSPAGIKLVGNQGNEWFEAANIYAATFHGTLSGNASSATTLQTTRTLWGQSFNGSNNVSGNMSGVGQITFSALSGTNGRALLYQKMADNDYFRIYAGGTASNSGYVEIATADDGNEPIYVRQYTGTFSTIKRTLTLLDANGYTHFPSYINIGGNENNNSSPDRVWGSNSSDSYLRSYRTSALRVAYAVNANSATTASSANKLTTARNIALGTDLRGSANFDGSGNITISANINACTVQVDRTNGLPFKRIAHFETGGSWNDNALLLYISQGYMYGSNGICRVEFRTDNISSSSTSVTASAAVRWLVRNGYGLDSLYAGYYVTAGKAYIDIYLKTTGGWQGTVIRVLQDSRGVINSNVQLINSYYYSDTNHKEAYNSIEAASTALYNRAYTRIVSGSDVGTVSYSNSTGSVHWNNVTNKPSSFTPSSHTHTWTSITDKLVAGNEFNIVNAGFNAGMWFNYVPINDGSKTATITGYHFGNGHQGYASIKASGFIKNGSSSSYVLLGDGGHKAISDFATSNHTHDHLRGHRLGYRHLDAGPKSSWSDSRLYIGYNGFSDDDYVTNSIGFYRSTGTGGTYTRTLWAEINSNGLWASNRFGVNGQNTGYNFYVNGTSLLNNTVRIQYNTPNLYIRNTVDTSYSIIRLGTNSNENASYIFQNGPSRTDDGGANTMTIRNNVGVLRLQNRVHIDSTGRIYPEGTSSRRAGMYGVHDLYKIGHIWSIGTAYSIPDNGADFGNLYGLAYKHTNNTAGGTMAGGHQAVWCDNGNPRSAIGYNGFWAAGGYYKNGSSDSYVLLGGGGHKAVSNFAPSSHSHNYAANENYGGFTKSGRLPISGFYQPNESESGGNAPWSSWVHLINCQHSNTGNNYALQIAASFFNNNTFKIRVTNNNVNNAWRDIIHSGNIGSQTVANAYHLRINSANTWSTWYWSGQSGQPSWLWGSNDGTNMYVWDPNNFNVHTAQYLRSLGNQNCQTGRTQNYGDVYTYNTYPGNTDSPTEYSSVIGFGRGMAGTVEIAGGWCNTHLYWRSLRDCCDDWYSWRTVLDSSNYTEFINNYYWANVKISTSSSTSTSPTVSNLTATNSIKMSNILLEHTDEINSASGLHLNFRSSGNVSLCHGGGNVGIGIGFPSHKLHVMGNTFTKGFGIIPYYLSDSNGLITVSPGDGYTYRCLNIGISSAVSCIIADRVALSNERGVLIKFNMGYDGQIVLLKDLEKYGSGNGCFWVMPSGCTMIRPEGSGTKVSHNQISNAYDDGKSRFFVYSYRHNGWIEFYCG